MKSGMTTILLALLTITGVCIASCALNPQPEPPLDLVPSGQGGGGHADAGYSGGSAGSSGGWAGAAGSWILDAGADDSHQQVEPDACNGDDCKCSEADGGVCDAACTDGPDAADSAEPDALEPDALEPDALDDGVSQDALATDGQDEAGEGDPP